MTKARKFLGASAIGLLLAIAPAASAIGQDNAVAQVVQQTDAQDPFVAAAAQEMRAAVERHQAAVREADELEVRAEALTPGEFMWMPERQESGEVVVVVSIAAQKAYVYRASKLIETDSPFLAPVPHRGRPCEPAYVADTARFLAALRGESVEQLAETTTDNFYRLFSKAKR